MLLLVFHFSDHPFDQNEFFSCSDYFSLDLVLTLIALLTIGFPATFFVTPTGTGARLAQSKNTSVKIDRPAHGSPQGERFSNHLVMIRSLRKQCKLIAGASGKKNLISKLK